MRPLLDLVPVVALVVLFLTAYRHPRGRTEAAIGLGAAAAVLTTGQLDLAATEDALRHLGPVVIFLATILVVADVCARSGMFSAASHRVVLASRGRPDRLLAGVFLLAALVTMTTSRLPWPRPRHCRTSRPWRSPSCSSGSLPLSARGSSRTGGPDRAQRRLRPDLHRFAGQPALAAHPAPAGRGTGTSRLPPTVARRHSPLLLAAVSVLALIT